MAVSRELEAGDLVLVYSDLVNLLRVGQRPDADVPVLVSRGKVRVIRTYVDCVRR